MMRLKRSQEMKGEIKKYREREGQNEGRKRDGVDLRKITGVKRSLWVSVLGLARLLESRILLLSPC